MKRDLKDVLGDMADRVQTAGQKAAEAIRNEENRDKAKEKAKDTASDVSDTVADLFEELGEGAKQVIQSKEVELAIDGVGDILKGVATRIRHSRESGGEETTDATEGDKATDTPVDDKPTDSDDNDEQTA